VNGMAVFIPAKGGRRDRFYRTQALPQGGVSYHTEHRMKNNLEGKWYSEYSADISASPEKIWRILSDVPGWKQWNAGVEQIEMKGAFVAGTEFLMTPPGEEPFLTQLIEVQENEVFVDKTCLGELVVIVTHRLEPIASNGTRVTYAIEAIGPGCDEIGPAVSADFPEVLKSLAKLAES
jgi:uncharacterized protein YndB with AHSA1/START domain